VPEERPRICLDLNVFVAAQIASLKGHHNTTPLRLVNACRAGQFDLIISRTMLDRLTQVLCRPPLRLTLAAATDWTELLAELAALPNLIVAGGGVIPLRDVEDRGVLETALAGRAHYLATYNLDDFVGSSTRDPTSGQLRVRNLTILHPRDLVTALGL
jgi:putative PIN family toxin of toxin-antitoxin system